MDQNNNGLVIVREFDAPRELVWRAWTEPEHFMRWWGPKDFTAPVATIDFKVGGKYVNCMRGAAGPGQPVKDFWGTGVYTEIIPLEKIVYTDNFADEHGNVVPASYYGMPGEWGPEGMVTVTIEGDSGKTKMTMSQTGIPEGQMTELTREGWNQSFDKLAESLKWKNVTE